MLYNVKLISVLPVLLSTISLVSAADKTANFFFCSSDPEEKAALTAGKFGYTFGLQPLQNTVGYQVWESCGPQKNLGRRPIWDANGASGCQNPQALAFGWEAPLSACKSGTGIDGNTEPLNCDYAKKHAAGWDLAGTQATLTPSKTVNCVLVGHWD